MNCAPTADGAVVGARFIAPTSPVLLPPAPTSSLPGSTVGGRSAMEHGGRALQIGAGVLAQPVEGVAEAVLQARLLAPTEDALRALVGQPDVLAVGGLPGDERFEIRAVRYLDHQPDQIQHRDRL